MEQKTEQPSVRPSSRIAGLGVSEILKIGQRAAARKAAGHDVIVLGAGEPDFDTPDYVKLAAKKAIDDGETKYTALTGTPQLKSAIAEKFSRENGLEYKPQEIIACAGAKQVLYNAFMATLEPGDEVIIPAPYWTSYPDIVRICGGVPVFVECGMNNGFRMYPEQLAAAITPRTRWLLLNSPSNPSGAAYGRTDYERLLEVLNDHRDVLVLADDIYEHIIHDDFPFVTPAQVAPHLKARTLTLNGVSKAYAMTGWRLGFAGGPASLIEAMAVVQSQSTSCPSSVSQAAATAALTGPQDSLKERQASFQARRDLVVSGLNAMKGVTCPVPQGAFYTFADCSGILGATTPDGKVIRTDSDFCAFILETANVAVVPGSAFGLSPFFRISYAARRNDLETALSRMDAAIGALT